MTPTDEVVPEPLPTESVLIVEGVLLSGQPFHFSVRVESGDTFGETSDVITYTSGLTGETTWIRGTAIASLTKTTRQVLKPKPKPAVAGNVVPFPGKS